MLYTSRCRVDAVPDKALASQLLSFYYIRVGHDAQQTLQARSRTGMRILFSAKPENRLKRTQSRLTPCGRMTWIVANRQQQ